MPSSRGGECGHPPCERTGKSNAALGLHNADFHESAQPSGLPDKTVLRIARTSQKSSKKAFKMLRRLVSRSKQIHVLVGLCAAPVQRLKSCAPRMKRSPDALLLSRHIHRPSANRSINSESGRPLEAVSKPPVDFTTSSSEERRPPSPCRVRPPQGCALGLE